MYRWVNPAKARYYQVHLDQDLFSGWSLVKVWGGLQDRRGNLQVHPLLSYEDGLKRIQAIDKRRRQRGYRPVEASAWN